MGGKLKLHLLFFFGAKIVGTAPSTNSFFPGCILKYNLYKNGLHIKLNFY